LAQALLLTGNKKSSSNVTERSAGEKRKTGGRNWVF